MRYSFIFSLVMAMVSAKERMSLTLRGRHVPEKDQGQRRTKAMPRAKPQQHAGNTIGDNPRNKPRIHGQAKQRNGGSDIHHKPRIHSQAKQNVGGSEIGRKPRIHAKEKQNSGGSDVGTTRGYYDDDYYYYDDDYYYYDDDWYTGDDWYQWTGW